MTLTAEDLERLIEDVYEAALAPERWASVLATAGRALGSTSASALWFDGADSTLIHAETWNVDPEAVGAYDQHYVAICPRLRMSGHFAAGEVYDDHHVRAAPTPAEREYYAFMDAVGCGLARTMLAERNGTLRMGLNFYGPSGEGTRPEERRLLHALAPHVRRACHLTLRVADLAEQAAFGLDLFERFSAMALLDSHGRVRRINARAAGIVAQGDGLRLVRGFLHAESPAEDARLQREIGAALGPKGADAPSPEGFALLSRPSGRPAWAVSAIPLSRRLRRGRPVPARALVTIAETVPRVDPARLRRGFGLSAAEAGIAVALAEGKRPEEIAAARGASVATVRAQLKSIFAKLDVSTQAQLVGRVAAACGMRLPSDPE